MESYAVARPGIAPQAPEFRPSEQRSSVATSLDSHKAVSSAGSAEKSGDRPSDRYPAGYEEQRKQGRELDFAVETGDLVYKALDISTGDIVWQWPAQSMIRLREYLQNEYPADAPDAPPSETAAPTAETAHAVDRLA